MLPLWVPFRWFEPVVPYLDPLITVVFSLVILPVPMKTVVIGMRDLMLIPPEEEAIQEIKRTVEPIIQGGNDSSLYYDIVKTGRKLSR